MVAATAIINRVAEIDSTKLFDDMIRRAKEHDFYPKLDFYHLGELDPIFEFGQFDYLARGGIAYIGSGILNKDHPLSSATERAIKADPEYWGASIEYYRPENRGVEYVEVAKGIEIAVFTEGLNTRISLLPEEQAANWFTGLSMEKRAMGKNIRALFGEKELKALRALFGEDEEGFDEFLERIKGINEDVKDRNLITRNKKEEPVEEPAELSDTDALSDTDEEPALVELDDEVVAAVVRVAQSAMVTELLTPITQGLESISAALATLTTNQQALTTGQQTLTATLNGVMERVGELEQSEEVKQREWLADLPQRSRVAVTYRPRQDTAIEPAPKTFADQAASVLATLPKVGA
jgi:hypothetical protein